MRTTLDLPDPMFRDLKIKAAREGVTMKQLLTSLVEESLYRRPAASSSTATASSMPVFIKAGKEPARFLTNAEIEELFTKEDAGY